MTEPTPPPSPASTPAPTPAPTPEAPPPVAGWAAPPSTPVPGAAGYVYGDVPNRVFALIIDAIILLVAYVIVGIVLAAIGLSTGTLATTGSFNPIGTLVLGIVLAVINAGYFVWSWTSMRATFGMRALGMQVGNAFDGKTLTMDQALRRAVALWGPQWAASFLSGVPVIGGLLSLLAFLWALYLLYSTATSPTKQGFHDKFANSVVVKAGRVV
jgi:uncharacterized RDD family membrane protein YckC